jgi:polyisoprenoid-binding protein YceI
MKRMILAAAVAAVACPALAAPETYTLDPNHTFPAFEVGHMGFSFQRGRFNKTTGRIAMDAAAGTGSADIAIEVASISTGHAKVEEDLKGEKFFNAAKNPQITFKSSSFRFAGEKLASASGDLTINGTTRPVTLTAEHFNCAEHPFLKRKACGAELTATIRRSDFGVTAFIPVVADEVKLRVNVEAIKD